MEKSSAATMTLEEVAEALTEAGVGFQLLYFSDAKKPGKRFGAACTKGKFYASEPVGALLHAASHFLREAREGVAEGEKAVANMRDQIAKVERLLPNLATDFVARPDGTCKECGTVHPKAEEVESLGGLLAALASGAAVRVAQVKQGEDEDEEDKEN